MVITDMETWLLDNADKIFRFWVFKRTFTPYEQQQAFMDETQYENETASYARIVDAIDLGSGVWLLGFHLVGEDGGPWPGHYTEYYPLNDIRLAYCDSDQPGNEEEEY